MLADAWQSRGKLLYDGVARGFYVARANAWTETQAKRLRVTPEDVIEGVRRGLTPDRIERLSPVAFLAEIAGRSTSPRDIFTIRALRKARAFWAPDRVAAE